MRSSRSVPALRPERGRALAPAAYRVYQSETAEILETPVPRWSRSAILLGAACLIMLFVLTLIMPMDRVVTSDFGDIVTTRPTIVLQALNPSVIKTIDVQEGARVKKDQLLATLDPTFAAADVNALKLRLDSLNAKIARIEDEMAHRPYTLPADLDDGAEQYARLQQAYYEQHTAQYNAQLHRYDQQISEARAAIVKYEQDEARYADRAEVSKEIEQMRAKLAKAQVGSKLNLLVATDQRLEMLRNLDFDHNLLVQKQHQLQATIAGRQAFVQQWRGDLSKDLVNAQNDRDTAREDLAKANRRRQLVRLVAPEDAVVLKMAKLSVGSVLKEGQSLVDLAPLHSPMEAELHVQARDVGFIRVGDPVTVKLTAFNFVAHGAAKGRIRWISQGAFSLSRDGQPVTPYYKVRVRLTKVKLRDVPKSFRLIPGMTLQGDIRVGTRSVFNYIMRGVIGGVGEAMREP